MQTLATVKAGLAKGLDFNKAAAAVEIRDESFRESVLDDVLKVLIAEEHFAKKVPLDELSLKLALSVELLEKARTEMFEDVEKTSVDAYYRNSEHGTEH
jgi:hypothetical protein